MVDKHNQEFFGKQSGIIFTTVSRSDPFLYVKCTKKKQNGSWEKFNANEGKTLKFNLKEIIMILKTLNKEIPEWTTFHSFKNNKTSISVRWSQSNGNEVLYLNFGDYHKGLNIAEIELLKRLLDHIINEKVEFGTVIQKREGQGDQEESVNEIQEIKNDMDVVEHISYKKIDFEPEIKPERNTNDEITKLRGAIKGETEKALLLDLGSQGEQWFPKSVFKAAYNGNKDVVQEFSIGTWFLKKNKLAA